MDIKGSIRIKNRRKFERCIELRKSGLSYSEIQNIIPVAKSTLQNWLAFSGLTLTKEHLEIQLRKSLDKRQAAVEASKLTRKRRKEKEIRNFIGHTRKFLEEPLFITGAILYEGEGTKNGSCTFSNSDYRLTESFLAFVEKYFELDRQRNIRYRVYIHETRKRDMRRIINFWSRKLRIPEELIKTAWKRNKIVGRRDNKDYVGQMAITVHSVSYLIGKLRAVSDIIMRKYCGVV